MFFESSWGFFRGGGGGVEGVGFGVWGLGLGAETVKRMKGLKEYRPSRESRRCVTAQ